MENLIGWMLLVAIVFIPGLVIYTGYKLYKKRKQETEEANLKREKILAELKREREATWERMRKGSTHIGKTTYDYNLDRSRTTVTEKDTGRKISYIHENDSGPDLLTTMIVANMLLNNKDSSAGTVEWKNDVPSVTTSSDEDNRKTSSWGSSPSYSDSGPSYSSSSDSGPSSDW